VILPAALLLLKPSVDKAPSDLRDAVNSPAEQLGLSEAAAQPIAGVSTPAPVGEKGWIKPPSPPVPPTPCPANWLNGTAKPGKPVEWVLLRGGNYTMGTNDEVGALFKDAKPVHKVGIKEFEMSKTEVTVAQYRECYAKGVCTCPKIAIQEDRPADSPITGITWGQANEYAKFAVGRLPTEAEWEYAATNEGQNVMYPWGNVASQATYETCKLRKAVSMDPDLLNGPTSAFGCGTGTVWPVCSMPGGNTAQGLCDMSGNVVEWVQDNYLPSYEGAPVDGSAVVVANSNNHVVRGGYFGCFGSSIRSDFRYHVDDVVRKDELVGVGFRLARDGRKVQ